MLVQGQRPWDSKNVSSSDSDAPSAEEQSLDISSSDDDDEIYRRVDGILSTLNIKTNTDDKRNTSSTAEKGRINLNISANFGEVENDSSTSPTISRQF